MHAASVPGAGASPVRGPRCPGGWSCSSDPRPRRALRNTETPLKDALRAGWRFEKQSSGSATQASFHTQRDTVWLPLHLDRGDAGGSTAAPPSRLQRSLTEARLPLPLHGRPRLLWKDRVLAERPTHPPRQHPKWPRLRAVCAQKGPDPTPERQLVCLEGRGTLLLTISLTILLITRPRVSTRSANTAARPARPETAGQGQLVLVGLLIGCGALQPFSSPWPLTLERFGKIRLLGDGFQHQLPSAILPLPLLSPSRAPFKGPNLRAPPPPQEKPRGFSESHLFFRC